MKALFLTLPLICVLSSTALAVTPQATVAPQTVNRIVATIGHEIITQVDVDLRYQMMLLTAPAPKDPEQINAFRKQILKMLIDERLQLAEAKKMQLVLSDDDLAKGVALIEQKSGLPKGKIYALLDEKKIPRHVFEDYVKANILWQKVVRLKLNTSVEPQAQEINDELARIDDETKTARRFVAEIVLPAKTPEQEKTSFKKMNEIVSQLHQGQPFDAIAQKHSIGETAAQGGLVGWVKIGSSTPEIEAELGKMKPGTISKPFKNGDTITLLLLQDEQKPNADGTFTVYALKRALFAPSVSLHPQEQAGQIHQAAQAITSCKQFESGFAHLNPGKIDVTELPAFEISPQLRELIAKTPVGKLTSPIIMPDHIAIVMVCGQKKIAPPKPSRDDVAHMLEMKNLNIASERMLRDLRRTNMIENRL